MTSGEVVRTWPIPNPGDPIYEEYSVRGLGFRDPSIQIISYLGLSHS